ncbi:hypothetical protein L3V43_10900 [Pseudoalteromonas sp. L23]|uniref:hypothetical protein n=1 Tax=unclassified Pseudoalteromonas TaxID=194690 RepID=UPI001EEFE8EF|nr:MULTISPECIES: hypothetical protein [unclassified Pseudoalteromonas]MCF7514085.1 hypothetical protein [Pseudoalteromonas sp. L7]MCF7526161.1 hypothetical protein [Pseudoalteromonas sp. L23]
MDSVSIKIRSVISSYELLRAIIAKPHSFSDFNILCLKDQTRFAKLNLPERNIVSMSLNRWKKYADDAIPIGWRGLDKLRKQALSKIKSESLKQENHSRGSKKYLQRKLEEEKCTSQSYLNEIVRFSEQYKHLLHICHIHARQDNDFKDLFCRHLKRYADTEPFNQIQNVSAANDD